MKLTERILVYLIIIFAVVGWSSNPLALQQMNKIQLNRASCDGIDKYYTNNGFDFDFNVMNHFYQSCYDSEGMFERWSIQPPANICKTKGYDCEDFAKATMCLCDLYNETCEAYMEVRTDSDRTLGIVGHSGVRRKQNGKWQTIA